MKKKRYDILLIEEDKVDQMAFQRFVKANKTPYDYTIAGSVAEAKNILASRKFDVVICDYSLGDGTAFEIFDLKIDVPVIVVTGSGNEEIAVKAMKAGAYYYLIKDPENNYLKVLSVTIENVIKRKRAEDEIKQYQFMVESAHDVIFFKDRDSRYIIANDKTLEIFGLSREEVIGKQDHELLRNKEEATKNVEDDQEVFKTCKPKEIIKHMEGANGKDYWFQAIKVPHFDTAGNITGLVCIARDITKYKQAEVEREQLLQELEVKNTELERFTYTVSHDLKAPLLTIQGFAVVMREDFKRNEREEADNHLNSLIEEAAKMEHLLDDTLQLSRIGRIVNPPEDVSFADIAKDAIGQASEQLKTNAVEVSVAEDLPNVLVDHLRIAEVLVNLITNSINYMGEQPHPKIDIGYRLDGKETVFFVTDNGIGIDKNQHEKVFTLFYKLDSHGNGTGAGLAIVKRIIEVHEGRIWIESEEGKGCTVCFTLPVCS